MAPGWLEALWLEAIANVWHRHCDGHIHMATGPTGLGDSVLNLVKKAGEGPSSCPSPTGAALICTSPQPRGKSMLSPISERRSLKQDKVT